MTAQQNVKDKRKQKGKSKAKGCVMVPIVLVMTAVGGGGIGWSLLSREHRVNGLGWGRSETSCPQEPKSCVW